MISGDVSVQSTFYQGMANIITCFRILVSFALLFFPLHSVPFGLLYWIAGLYQGGAVPEGLELYSFPESSWAVFTARGPMPGSLQTLNTAVWQEWFPNEGQKYHANGTATLEVYSAGNPQSPDYECGIWVPIQ